MLLILAAGFVTGLLISAPLGPMAALAALKLNDGQWRGAVAVAAGSCTGDTLLAVAALGLLNIPLIAKIPTSLMVGVAVAVLGVMSAWMWHSATVHPKTEEGAAEEVKSGILAAFVTLTHPANVVAYLTLYATMVPMIAGVHPADMGVGAASVLVLATLGGLAAGWMLFFQLLALLKRQFGMHPRVIRPWLARGTSVLLAVSACGLLIWFLKHHA